MAKSKESVKAMITEEQLKIVNDQQLNLNELLRNIGILESQKQSIHSKVLEISKQIDETKKELEEEYGQVNIDLKDGCYTDIEKKDEE
jgi:peptidoglycan hydrolase CwlO-like protein